MATIYTFVVSFPLTQVEKHSFHFIFLRKFLSVIPMGPSLFKSLRRRHLEMSLGKNEG